MTLLAWRPWRRVAANRLWDVGHDGAVVLALLTIPGFLFAWWARLHLGRLWSGTVTRKADHRIVDTGPYAIVRHPIYTGLLASRAGFPPSQAARSSPWRGSGSRCSASG